MRVLLEQPPCIAHKLTSSWFHVSVNWWYALGAKQRQHCCHRLPASFFDFTPKSVLTTLKSSLVAGRTTRSFNLGWCTTFFSDQSFSTVHEVYIPCGCPWTPTNPFEKHWLSQSVVLPNRIRIFDDEGEASIGIEEIIRSGAENEKGLHINGPNGITGINNGQHFVNLHLANQAMPSRSTGGSSSNQPLASQWCSQFPPTNWHLHHQ